MDDISLVSDVEEQEVLSVRSCQLKGRSNTYQERSENLFKCFEINWQGRRRAAELNGAVD